MCRLSKSGIGALLFYCCLISASIVFLFVSIKAGGAFYQDGKLICGAELQD
jgi:hypothetical protein